MLSSYCLFLCYEVVFIIDHSIYHDFKHINFPSMASARHLIARDRDL